MRCVGLEPIYNEKSRILILGTMPGAKSLECGEYYSDKKNIFWKILFEIFKEKEIYDYKDKKQFLLEHHIALWDVLKECDRDKKDGSESSSDRYIYNDIPNDISTIIKESNIETIVLNGKTKSKGIRSRNPYKYYMKYIYENVKITPVLLPSTSGVNTHCSFEDKVKIWSDVLK